MKKLLTLLLLSGLGITAQAQEKNSFEFGGHIGLNAATVSSSNNVNSDYRIGFNVTAVGDYFFSDRWSIKAKIGYDQKGWDNGYLENLDTGDTYQTNYRTDYITIPVMANWHFGKKRNWYLNFGPYVGILVNATETKLGTDFKDFFNTTDIGIDLGIGVKVPVANKLKVLFEFDGQAGLTDLVRNNQGSALQNSRSSFNVGLVYGM